MAVDLATIEDAILACIKAANLSYLQTLGSYAGDLDGKLDDVLARLPAVWVALKSLGASKSMNTAQSVYRVPATWAVIVAACNPRGGSGTSGDNAKAGVGTNRMLTDVGALLVGRDLGLEIEAWRPGRARSIASARYRNLGVSIYAQEWHTVFDMRASERDTGAVLGSDGQPTVTVPSLRTAGINYYLKPGDDVADAADLLTLQESRAATTEETE